MKPDKNQINNLLQTIQTRHTSKFQEIDEKAKAFAGYLGTLLNFTIVNVQLPAENKHVGRVIVDGVLQVGHDYEKQVRLAVARILKFQEAVTASGFIKLLSQRKLSDLINFKTDGTKNDLLLVAKFFADKGVETYANLYAWLEPEKNRDSLLTKQSGLSGDVFSISDKTADYFRVLVYH